MNSKTCTVKFAEDSLDYYYCLLNQRSKGHHHVGLVGLESPQLQTLTNQGSTLLLLLLTPPLPYITVISVHRVHTRGQRLTLSLSLHPPYNPFLSIPHPTPSYSVPHPFILPTSTCSSIPAHTPTLSLTSTSCTLTTSPGAPPLPPHIHVPTLTPAHTPPLLPAHTPCSS